MVSFSEKPSQEARDVTTLIDHFIKDHEWPAGRMTGYSSVREAVWVQSRESQAVRQLYKQIDRLNELRAKLSTSDLELVDVWIEVKRLQDVGVHNTQLVPTLLRGPFGSTRQYFPQALLLANIHLTMLRPSIALHYATFLWEKDEVLAQTAVDALDGQDRQAWDLWQTLRQIVQSGLSREEMRRSLLSDVSADQGRAIRDALELLDADAAAVPQGRKLTTWLVGDLEITETFYQGINKITLDIRPIV